ncbi:spore coat protein U domain-containing protein [Asaia siamensis]
MSQRAQAGYEPAARSAPRRLALWPVLCKSLTLSVLTPSLCYPLASHAQTSMTGTIKVSMNLTAACSIGDTILASGANFGNLDFGSDTTLFETKDAQVLSGNAGGISMTCSPGISPQLTVTGGSHDMPQNSGGYLHALANGVNTIPYNLYLDAGRSTVLQNGTPVPLVAASTTYTANIYGRVFGGKQASALPAGEYSDTINVTLSF